MQMSQFHYLPLPPAYFAILLGLLVVVVVLVLATLAMRF